MKEHKDPVVVITYGSSDSSVTASPISHQTPSVPTPFSFAYSVTPSASRFSSRRASVHVSGLVLRFITLVLCFVSALSLAVNVHRPSLRHRTQSSSSFASHPELLYCFGVAVTGFVYTSLQTFKGICDITHRGVLISEPLSDYISFILDQVICYLLVSSSSVAIAWIQHRNEDAMKNIRKNSIVSASMSFSAFLVLTLSTLFSGYKLCKRFMW
ncbi:hypothetical protein EUTSA_v10028959mg [Eutrema salsugineum]|uniref:CASP-like protein n=1 Tax=Eutrema salsugineum TaxID=72664 RepID=V4L7K5_EUTSA|nr:CASP-like protein 4A4 [Eutrema salsugineum]ESQ38322.1 hypothetical protein EUTSA_v10028959mg [Eutrema salsugineum]